MDARYVSLVERAIQHDEDAFWQLYEMKWRAVFYTTLKSLNDENDAADAAQEAFLQAYKNIGSLKHPEAFNAWLYRIVVNTCNTALAKLKIERANKSDGETELDLLSDERKVHAPEISLERKADGEMLLKAINALPESQRTAVVLHYYNQMTYSEIAEATGLTKNGVETRLRRAREAMRAYIEEHDGKATASALIAAPLLTTVLSHEEHVRVLPQMGETLRVAIESGIAFLAAGGVAAGAGGGAAASGATGVSAGTLSTTTATVTVGTGTKIALGVAATILIVGTTAGIAYQANRHESEPTPTKSVVTTPKENPKPTEETTETVVEEAVVEEVTPETPIEQPTTPVVVITEEPAPAQVTGINSLADMIGATSAQRLIALDQYATKAETRGLLGSIGTTLKYQQRDPNGETYSLYVLEKEDKRLYVIEKDGADYGISYVFENRSNPLPASWELVFRY